MIEQLMMFVLKDALFLLGYQAKGNAFPKPLGREEEATLIDAMSKGDRQAREKLIAHNLRLCAHIARKYSVPGYDADDLISILSDSTPGSKTEHNRHREKMHPGIHPLEMN